MKFGIAPPAARARWKYQPDVIVMEHGDQSDPLHFQQWPWSGEFDAKR